MDYFLSIKSVFIIFVYNHISPVSVWLIYINLGW